MKHVKSISKKAIVILALSVLFVSIGCLLGFVVFSQKAKVPVKVNDKVLINELSSGDRGLFSIGMKKKDITDCLEQNHIDYKAGFVINNNAELSIWDLPKFFIKDKPLTGIDSEIIFDESSFMYLKNNSLIDLYYNRLQSSSGSSRFQTAAGLKIGDDEATIKKLYGNHYKAYAPCEGRKIYLYHIKKLYLDIELYKDFRVTGWEIAHFSPIQGQDYEEVS